MIVLDVEQNTPEWMAARSAIPTASAFSKIVTSTGKASAQSSSYMNKLLSEWLSGKPEESYSNKIMERGHQLEDEAINHLEFHADVEIKKVGLIYKDDRKLISCSPDGLIEPDSGAEAKCPTGSTQIKYLLASKLPSEYVPQVQGSLWITGRDTWKFISYHPDLPPLVLTIERDEKYIKTLSTMVNDFVGKMLLQREKLIKMGHEPETLQEAA